MEGKWINGYTYEYMNLWTNGVVDRQIPYSGVFFERQNFCGH